MNLIMMCLVLAWSLLGSGCAHLAGPANKLDPTRIALAYYNQARVQETVRVEAREGESITISGVKTLVLTTQLPPLSVYPREPNALREFMEGLWKVGTVVGSTVVGAKLVDGLSAAPKTVPAQIVEVPVVP